MEPENDGFQKESPFPGAVVWGSMLNFRGGNNGINYQPVTGEFTGFLNHQQYQSSMCIV